MKKFGLYPYGAGRRKVLQLLFRSFKVTLKGALLTGALFTIGKIVLGRLLISGNIQRIYGTSGSFVILLLFVFYISLILYYGAAFTAALADYSKEAIRPAAHARFQR